MVGESLGEGGPLAVAGTGSNGSATVAAPPSVLCLLRIEEAKLCWC
jgi:hypothetical protein